MPPTTAETLRLGCAALGLDPEPNQLAQLEAYLALLQKWNRAYNLTAVREPQAMVTLHLLDSLAIAPQIVDRRCLDVGSGAGLPGVPLAISRPESHFDLLDSNGKKTRFLFQVKTGLGLANMAVHHARVEEFRPQALYDVILSRAFASLGDMLRGCRHLLAPGGRFLAMKGVYPGEELDAIADDIDLQAVIPLTVPGLSAERHLVVMGLR